MDLKREIKLNDVSPQVRVVVLLGLVLAMLGAVLTLFVRSHSGTSSTSAATVATTKPIAPARPARTHARQQVVPTGPPALPASVERGLASNQVVVVSLYAPGVAIDKLALLEAKAGAADVNAAFAAVDVTRSAVDSLTSRYSVLHDPTVLILRPPDGELVVKLDGFADENTVAQAAAPAGQQ